MGRLGEGDELEVRARRQDRDSNWIYNLDGMVPILYQMQLLVDVHFVFVCDNERAADAVNADLNAVGQFGRGKAVATTTLEGLTHLHRTDLSPLLGKELIFLPSEDGDQNLYPNAVLEAIDKRANFRVVALPDRGKGGDYTHFRAAGHTFEEAWALIKATPRFKARA